MTESIEQGPQPHSNLVFPIPVVHLYAAYDSRSDLKYWGAEVGLAAPDISVPDIHATFGREGSAFVPLAQQVGLYTLATEVVKEGDDEARVSHPDRIQIGRYDTLLTDESLREPPMSQLVEPFRLAVQQVSNVRDLACQQDITIVGAEALTAFERALQAWRSEESVPFNERFEQWKRERPDLDSKIAADKGRAITKMHKTVAHAITTMSLAHTTLDDITPLFRKA